jgi:hypothetical protein
VVSHHLIGRTIRSGVAVAAIAFPAWAHATQVPPHSLAINSYSLRALKPDGPVSQAPTQSSSQPGFQWADAGIGAGAAVLLTAAAVGGGMTRRRRIQRSVIG